MSRTYAVVGRSAAADAATAALDDALDSTGTDLDAVARADIAVVVGLAGSDGFAAANDRARAGDTPWVAVEVGGVGGHAVDGVDASVSAFAPDSACFACLHRRVAATDPETTATPSAASSTVRYAGALAGKRALDLLDDPGVGGTAVEVPHAEHAFERAPFCDACGTSERYGDPGCGDDDAALDEAVRRAEAAVDSRAGVVTEVGERETYPAPYYLATAADTAALGEGSSQGLAAGVGLDWDDAFVKAVGEGLERYCAAVYRSSDFTLGRPTHPDAVGPDAFVRPGDAPTPAPDETLSWVPGVDLRGGAVRLPAEFVHFPPPEETYRPALTTGLGLGTSPVQALCSGLSETIERDASMLAWYSTFDPLELDVRDETYETLERRAGAEGLDVTALLLTQDVDVPVVAAAVHREGDWPKLAFGSAASLDAADAARSALCEAIQNWIELRDMGRERAASEQGAIADYADFPREARDFLDADASVPLADVGPADPPTGDAELAALLDRLGDAGLDAYASDLTTRDVAALGFRAVRVLVPDAQPLFFDDPYFGERAREVPAELGFEAALERRHHPFP